MWNYTNVRNRRLQKSTIILNSKHNENKYYYRLFYFIYFGDHAQILNNW